MPQRIRPPPPTKIPINVPQLSRLIRVREQAQPTCEGTTNRELKYQFTNLLETYYIDKEGYLLDKDNFYLLNERNEQIRLSQREIDMLRKFKVLE